MHDRKNDPEVSAAGSGDQPSMDAPMRNWAQSDPDSWMCAALTELPRAIQRLSAAEQAAVIGHYFDERPIDELAASLQMEPERVRFVLQQALRELRRQVPQ